MSASASAAAGPHLVLDASVAIAAARDREPSHVAARALVDRVLRGEVHIVVPPLFRIEVVAGLARRGHPLTAVERFATALLDPRNEVVTIGPTRGARIAALAGRLRLRAADACYVWVAQRHELPLVTLDEELLGRAIGVDARRP